MYFSKLWLRTQFLVAIKFVRAFLGIVEKWFWRLFVGAMKTLKGVKMLISESAISNWCTNVVPQTLVGSVLTSKTMN